MVRQWLFALTCFSSAWLSICGGGGPWNKYEYEYDYIEAVMLISLVILVLGFEIVYHHLWHRVKHSYQYGQIHDEINLRREKTGMEKDSHGNLSHHRLLKELFRRMSGEFMALGFLALTIFACNQAELFDAIANKVDVCTSSSSSVSSSSSSSSSSSASSSSSSSSSSSASSGDHSSDCWHFPPTGPDWLHMAEVVHVKLFFAMILYFALMLRVTLFANGYIEQWERLRLRLIWRQSQKEEAPPAVDEELQRFSNMRDYLLKNLMLWKETRKVLKAKLLKKTGTNADGSKIKSEIKLPELIKELDKRLSMSAYLSLHVEEGVADSIEVHIPTWLGVFFIFGTYAVLGRYAKVELSHFIPFFIFLCLLFVVFMYAINHSQQRAIIHFHEKHSESDVVKLIQDEENFTTSSSKPNDEQGDDAIEEGVNQMTPAQLKSMQTRKWYQRFNMERNALHMLQIVVFFLTYTLAETLADKHKWKDNFDETLVFALVYLLIYIFMVAVIPRELPAFLQFTALPPFLNQTNINLLLHVLLDDHVIQERKEEKKNLLASSALTDEQREREFAAVVELADVIGQCHDFEQLAHVRQTLEERMQAVGLNPARLPVLDTC